MVIFIGKLCEMDSWKSHSSCSNWGRQNAKVNAGSVVTFDNVQANWKRA